MLRRLQKGEERNNKHCLLVLRYVLRQDSRFPCWHLCWMLSDIITYLSKIYLNNCLKFLFLDETIFLYAQSYKKYARYYCSCYSPSCRFLFLFLVCVFRWFVCNNVVLYSLVVGFVRSGFGIRMTRFFVGEIKHLCIVLFENF